MDDKLSDAVKSICTILGGALLLYPLIDEATKTLIPEMQKLASGETLDGLNLLPPKQEERPQEKQEPKENQKPEEKQEPQGEPERQEREC